MNAKCEILIKQKNNLFSQKGNYSRLLLLADGRVKRATTLLLLMAITFYFTLQINNMNYFVCVFYSFHSDDTAMSYGYNKSKHIKRRRVSVSNGELTERGYFCE